MTKRFSQIQNPLCLELVVGGRKALVMKAMHASLFFLFSAQLGFVDKSGRECWCSGKTMEGKHFCGKSRHNLEDWNWFFCVF